MNNKALMTGIAVAGITLGLMLGGVFHKSTDTLGSKADTAYDRTMRTQTLRCGYVVFPPGITKDPNTGKMSGLDYDVAEIVGRKLGLKVEWTQEVGWGTAIAGLNAGKYDALCNASWVNPTQSREAYFSRAYLYQPLFAAVRTNDKRFDESLEPLNSADIKIGSLDGDNPKFIAEEDFPKAQIYTLPDMSGIAMVLDSVASGKADATFTDAYEFGDYNEHNPGKLKLVQIEQPVRLYPAAFILPIGDDKFRFMINTALTEIIYSGQMEKILQHYAKYPYSFLHVEHPHVMEMPKF